MMFKFFVCFVNQFYIKPQLIQHDPVSGFRSILLEFYIKPQHILGTSAVFSSCILLKSTSNHNTELLLFLQR